MRRWSIAGLVLVLLFDVWLRGHTVGPALREKTGLNFYAVSGAESEPLDCDEAVYAYIGDRIAAGSVMYRDMTENKPPLGYWSYALAVRLFGMREFTIRLMPVPPVLLTVVLVWWLVLRLRGPGSAVVGAFVFAVVSTDPFLFGNGANMEHLINLFATASLAALVAGWDRPGRFWVLTAGVCVGLAALIKQVAAVHGLVYAVALLGRSMRMTGDGETLRPVGSRFVDLFALALGFALVWGVAAAVLVSQNAARDAYEDVFRYGRAYATDTPPPPNAPPAWERWVTGNADPQGRLPWPFGRTDYLVWWGAGSWPVWVAAVPSLMWLAFPRKTTGPRRLAAAWTASAMAEVVLPGQYWQHYYLLPVPGLAVAVAVFLGDQFDRSRRGFLRWAVATVAVPGLIAALGWTGWLQWNEYLQVPPEQLTVRDKGGAQWLVHRAKAREIVRRTEGWKDPRLFLWGWQSTLYFYTGMAPATRQLFTDDLIRAYADKDHPLIRPRVDRIMRDLEARPPEFIYAGYPPFARLRTFIEARYLSSSVLPGLWVLRERFSEFEAAGR